MTEADRVTTTRTRPELLVAIEDDSHQFTWSGPGRTEARSSAVRRIRQPELRGGIKARAALRAGWQQLGEDPADLVVALEIDVVIAEDAATARAELLRLGESRFGDTVRYVGTANGLLTLIADIYTAEVADAVILRPLDQGRTGERPGSAQLIADRVLPGLLERDTAA